MMAMLIVGDSLTAAPWANALRASGHAVEHRENAIDFQERFAGGAPDGVVLLIRNADRGEAMLIPQCRAIWPECRIIAVTPDFSFRASAIYRMGLWSPDLLLTLPILPGELCAAVFKLIAQTGEARPRRGMQAPDRSAEVIIAPRATRRPRWAIDPL